MSRMRSVTLIALVALFTLSAEVSAIGLDRPEEHDKNGTKPSKPPHESNDHLLRHLTDRNITGGNHTHNETGNRTKPPHHCDRADDPEKCRQTVTGPPCDREGAPGCHNKTHNGTKPDDKPDKKPGKPGKDDKKDDKPGRGKDDKPTKEDLKDKAQVKRKELEEKKKTMEAAKKLRMAELEEKKKKQEAMKSAAQAKRAAAMEKRDVAKAKKEVALARMKDMIAKIRNATKDERKAMKATLAAEAALAGAKLRKFRAKKLAAANETDACMKMASIMKVNHTSVACEVTNANATNATNATTGRRLLAAPRSRRELLESSSSYQVDVYVNTAEVNVADAEKKLSDAGVAVEATDEDPAAVLDTIEGVDATDVEAFADASAAETAATAAEEEATTAVTQANAADGEVKAAEDAVKTAEEELTEVEKDIKENDESTSAPPVTTTAAPPSPPPSTDDATSGAFGTASTLGAALLLSAGMLLV